MKPSKSSQRLTALVDVPLESPEAIADELRLDDLDGITMGPTRSPASLDDF